MYDADGLANELTGRARRIDLATDLVARLGCRQAAGGFLCSMVECAARNFFAPASSKEE